jgi:hypothetical protein
MYVDIMFSVNYYPPMCRCVIWYCEGGRGVVKAAKDVTA